MIKTVFLTGATGNMGWAGFKELYARRDEFNIRILARKSKKNIKPVPLCPERQKMLLKIKKLP